MSTLLRPSQSSGQSEQAPGKRSRGRGFAVVFVAVAVIAGVVLSLALRTPVPRAASNNPPATLAQDRAPAAADAVADSRPNVLGYLPYWQQPSAVRAATAHADLLTTAAPWWYSPTADGGVVEQDPPYTDISDAVVDQLREPGLGLLPTIANHRNGEWDFEVVPRLIADPRTRADHVRNLVQLVVDDDYDGIVIDYELLRADDRANFTAFVTALAEDLHAHAKRLAVTVHAKSTPEGSGGHNAAQDYVAIGRAADEVHLMTYDLHYDESEPGPVAPQWWVERVVAFAVKRIPKEKLLLGVGLYGYDWGDGEVAADLTLGQVNALRAATNARVQRSFQAPFFRYRRAGVDHEVWYEDRASVAAKLTLVDRYDLGGAFFWHLGDVPADIWDTAAGQLGRDS
jgi:spore germination protein YaaH